MAAVILVCYILYTMSDEVLERVGESYLYLTSLFVFLGIAKYFQITLVQQKSGSPTKMLYSNVFLQVIILLWIVSFGAFIYL